MNQIMTTPTSSVSRTKERQRAQLWESIERVIPESDPTSILLFRQVHQANHLLTQAAKKQLEAAGLSWPKFMLMLLLQGNETYGAGRGLQPSALSDLMGIPRNHVSTLIAALEEAGLIHRELHGTDRRGFIIRLTPRGRKTLRSRLGAQCRQITRCFAAFKPKECATLLALLTRLTQSLAEMPDRDEG